MLRVLCLVLALATPARGCETALVLAIDVSGSIDRGEYGLQADGLADALLDSAVADALAAGKSAVAVVHWSGIGQQALVLPWQRVTDAGAVEDLARRIRATPRAFAASDTAVGQAIDFSLSQFASVTGCQRKVIDISGDGAENAGFTVARARQTATRTGVEINAIAIEDMGASAPVSAFYRRWAITRGGFVMTARGLSDYRQAIRAKLLRELGKPAS